MAKESIGFEHYLSDIPPDFGEMMTGLHGLLTGLGCPVKLQEAKSGHVVSYTHPSSKKTVANFLSRKSGPVIRIYGDCAASGYPQVLEALPDTLAAKVAKAPDCKRMLDPSKCNSRCAMGYDITIRGDRHQKCRYNCFLFPVTAETLPHIQEMLRREMEGRSA